jgi:hypothetical protein
MYRKVTIALLQALAQDAMRIAATYSRPSKTEFFYDPIIFALLSERRFGRVKRQYDLPRLPRQKRRSRIDYYVGGNTPVLIELACRTYGGELLPGCNGSELKKLIRKRKARTRFLLLLDPTKHPPHREKKLKGQYEGWRPGKGNFLKLPVRVVYVRRDHAFHFVWKRS